MMEKKEDGQNEGGKRVTELGYGRQLGKFERVVSVGMMLRLENLHLLVTTGVDSGERMVSTVRRLQEVSS